MLNRNTPSQHILEIKLGEALRKSLDECRSLKHNPNGFINVVHSKGLVSACSEVVLKQHSSDGFAQMWLVGRLDLSVEALILREPWCGLFPKIVLDKARKRLMGCQPRQPPLPGQLAA